MPSYVRLMKPTDYCLPTLSFYVKDKSDFTCSRIYKYYLLYLSDEYDSYIIVSFVNATLVLSIGETVEEVTDSGFLGTTPTLSCSSLGEDALVQVKILKIRPILLTHDDIFVRVSPDYHDYF